MTYEEHRAALRTRPSVMPRLPIAAPDIAVWLEQEAAGRYEGPPLAGRYLLRPAYTWEGQQAYAFVRRALAPHLDPSVPLVGGMRRRVEAEYFAHYLLADWRLHFSGLQVPRSQNAARIWARMAPTWCARLIAWANDAAHFPDAALVTVAGSLQVGA